MFVLRSLLYNFFFFEKLQMPIKLEISDMVHSGIDAASRPAIIRCRNGSTPRSRFVCCLMSGQRQCPAHVLFGEGDKIDSVDLLPAGI